MSFDQGRRNGFLKVFSYLICNLEKRLLPLHSQQLYNNKIEGQVGAPGRVLPPTLLPKRWPTDNPPNSTKLTWRSCFSHLGATLGMASFSWAARLGTPVSPWGAPSRRLFKIESSLSSFNEIVFSKARKTEKVSFTHNCNVRTPTFENSNAAVSFSDRRGATYRKWCCLWCQAAGFCGSAWLWGQRARFLAAWAARLVGLKFASFLFLSSFWSECCLTSILSFILQILARFKFGRLAFFSLPLPIFYPLSIKSEFNPSIAMYTYFNQSINH